MKKSYTKPEIVYESFLMSTNIAGNCESIVGNPSKGACPVKGTGDINMFSGTLSFCDFAPEDMGGVVDEWDGACYHVPTEYNNLFNS